MPVRSLAISSIMLVVNDKSVGRRREEEESSRGSSTVFELTGYPLFYSFEFRELWLATAYIYTRERAVKYLGLRAKYCLLNIM